MLSMSLPFIPPYVFSVLFCTSFRGQCRKLTWQLSRILFYLIYLWSLWQHQHLCHSALYGKRHVDGKMLTISYHPAETLFLNASVESFLILWTTDSLLPPLVFTGTALFQCKLSASMHNDMKWTQSTDEMFCPSFAQMGLNAFPSEGSKLSRNAGW